MRNFQRRRLTRSSRVPTLSRSSQVPTLLVLLAIIAMVFAACGGSAASPASAGGSETSSEAQPAIGDEAYAAASAAPAFDQGQVAPAPEEPAKARDGTVVQAVAQDELLVVYTGSLELVVDDLQAALAKAKTAVLATGGYIGASQESDNGDRPVAVITYRIPASRWEDALGSLRGIAAKVAGEQTQAAEVGGQMTDLAARIRNLRASEEVLVDIAKGTGKVSDLLEVQARISDVRGQIEQLEGQRARLADQAAYGTLVATFGTEIVQVQEVAAGWDPKQDVDGATATLVGAGQAIVSALIWFAIVWLPVLAVLGVLAFVGYKAARAIGRRMTPPVTPPSGPVTGWGEHS
jgi:hypothetical protein